MFVAYFRHSFRVVLPSANKFLLPNARRIMITQQQHNWLTIEEIDRIDEEIRNIEVNEVLNTPVPTRQLSGSRGE